MESLDKEFFNEIEAKCPFAIDVFKKWVIEYAKSEIWGKLFRDGIEFYDIPYEMQMGIMNKFFIETYAGKAEYRNRAESHYREEMILSIEQLQSRLRPATGLN